MKETRNPTPKVGPMVDNSPALNKSINCLSPDPRIIGKAKRKLNLVAELLSSPVRRPPEIVAPDLETPGIKANA